MPAADAHPIRAHVYNVPFGNDLCDATASLVLQAMTSDPLSVSNHILLLPNNRAVKAMGEAFVRKAAPGLLLPHMVAVGDLALDEALGPMLDPVSAEENIWPVIGTVDRILLLAKLVARHRPTGPAISSAEALRLARKLADMIDELEIEQVDFSSLAKVGIEADLAGHWQSSYGQLLEILPAYYAELTRRQLLGPADRRNILLARLERRLAETPPDVPILAAGITTSAKAITRLLHRIARMPQGAVILPGVDLQMDEEQWAALSHATDGEGEYKPRHNIEVHPQFHLKHLLDQIGVHRSEVDAIPTGNDGCARHAIADVFCLPEQSAGWRDLPDSRKKLPHVRLVEAADSAEEAKAIAVHVRGALERAGQRIAVITPDRELAVRIAAQLRRWGIEVDDSAGTPLLQTPHGTFALALVDAIASRFSATSILAIAKHPLVKAGEQRLSWLESARALDMGLRGPPEGVGLSTITSRLKAGKKDNEATQIWWAGFADILAPLDKASGAVFADLLDTVQNVATILTSGAVWRGANGRELARIWEEIASGELGMLGAADPAAIVAIFSELFSGAVVRPPYGGHPRVAIYGLLEARLQQADIIICAGLNETSWPQIAQPDPWLAPAIRRHLGLATLDRNIGLSAHDLGTALGAKNVLLTRAKRDRGGPTVASRFLLRMQAYLGSALIEDIQAIDLARRIDRPEQFIHIEPPRPAPSATQRRVDMRITDFDRLKADPYAFYANKILRLLPLEAVDAMPDHAWRGSAIHKILEEWATHDRLDPDKLLKRAADLLSNPSLHPALRALWQPRISAALRWVAEKTLTLKIDEHRIIAVAEEDGHFALDGINISGRVDRIDRLADGGLAIIDYKKGDPPKNAQIKAGYALQLGLLGLMAEADGFKTLKGNAALFEYWSLAKDKKTGSYGYIQNPVSGKKGAPADAENFMATARVSALDAISRWINGKAAFVAKLHPKYAVYADYDQLMRLQEWDGRIVDEADET